MRVEFRLLGEISARLDGRRVDLGSARQRCVLAALLVDANHVVSLDQLADRVWGEGLPQRAAGTLRSYMSRLRAAVPVGEEWGIRRRSGGYLLEIDEAAVDLHRFHRLSVEARTNEDAVDAVALYEQALALWAGEAFADLDTPWLTALRHTLQSERFAAQLDYHDVQLRRGKHTMLLPDLTSLTSVHPLDERLAGQLMLAFYRSGRQAEALERYEEIRRRLDDELGVAPGPTLQQLHQQILTADPALISTGAPASARIVPVPRTLPAPPRLFIGRSRELAALDEALDAGDGSTKTVVISAISGPGGIGKTCLALYWAHRNLDKFPDGQLYVNLRGFDPCDSPMPSDVAIRTFLDVLGVDAAAIPARFEAQVALYRSLVADKRMLIVLDNARDTTHLTPLLPGGSSCVVLVTGRHHLAALVTGHGARSITLNALKPAEAHRLLVGRLRTARAQAEPAAMAELVDYCAGLPLALSIVAARAAARPDFPQSALAQQLRTDSTRLDALDAGEPTANLRAVFSWSYRTLTPQAASLFRLLGLHPGPDVAELAVANLAGLALAKVRLLLAELTGAHLIAEHRPGRYAFNDLLRAYAAEQAHALDPRTERDAALHRVLDYYLHTAHTAALLLYPERPPIALTAPVAGVSQTELADDKQAMAWFTAEYPVLVAAIHRAAGMGLTTHTWQLAWTLVAYLDQPRNWPDLSPRTSPH